MTTSKYVHTPQGIFELKYFFSSSINRVVGDAIASESVKERIRKLVAAEDRVYITDREGTTMVLRHGTRFEVLECNELGEGVASSMALAGHQIFLRGEKHLYCIADTSDASK